MARGKSKPKKRGRRPRQDGLPALARFSDLARQTLAATDPMRDPKATQVSEEGLRRSLEERAALGERLKGAFAAARDEAIGALPSSLLPAVLDVFVRLQAWVDTAQEILPRESFPCGRFLIWRREGQPLLAKLDVWAAIPGTRARDEEGPRAVHRDPPDGTEPGVAHPDGPEPPDTIWWKGNPLHLRARLYRLAEFMWNRDRATADEVEQSVYDSDVKGSTLRSDICHLNEEFTSAGIRPDAQLCYKSAYVLWRPCRDDTPVPA